MFAPRRIKQSAEFRKGVEKFVNYKRHLLAPGRHKEIQRGLGELRALEISKASPEELKAKQNVLEELARSSVPASALRRQGWFAENVDVLFTAVVIALGIRAFFLQPFKIPTGSMQPTLNGFIGKPIAESEEFPGFAQRTLERVWNGRTYADVRATRDDVIEKISETSILLFFTTTRLHMRSGDVISIPGPKAVALHQSGLGELAARRVGWGDPRVDPPPIPVKAGEILARASIQGGDQLLVDKMSYHFRPPRRGEVFVFGTKGIKGIENSDSYRPEFGSQHYIKRLAAVPDDTVEIRPDGELWINGARAGGHGFDLVMSKEDGYNGYIIPLHQPGPPVPNPFILKEGDYPAFWTGARNAQPAYWALGDNQRSSADSRYWGPVPEMNLVGPALFVYWPLGNHFGLIR